MVGGTRLFFVALFAGLACERRYAREPAIDLARARREMQLVLMPECAAILCAWIVLFEWLVISKRRLAHEQRDQNNDWNGNTEK